MTKPFNFGLTYSIFLIDNSFNYAILLIKSAND